MLRFTIVLLSLFYYHFLSAQEKHLYIDGRVLSANGDPLTDASVSITQKNSSLILSYYVMGSSNFFSIRLPYSSPDSLVITVRHSGFFPAIKTIKAMPGEKSILEFILHFDYRELDPLTLKPVPIWERGDTTFINPSAFKNGDERKLGELLKNIPEFKVTEQGTIFFKGRQIDKIKIGNEELFADKPELLAKTFPLHVIKTIQAIENNSPNKLLKGLQGNENVIINIDLDKKVSLNLFGDAEVGAGNLPRYKINPVLFSLRKIKIGFISTSNNLGSSTNSWTRIINNGQTYKQATSPLIPTSVTPYIQDFAQSRYNTNRTFDNRLSITTSLGKKLNFYTEITSINDRVSLERGNQLSILSGNRLKERQVTTTELSQFRFFALTPKIEWLINSKSSLITNASLLLDNSRKNDYGNIIENLQILFFSSTTKNKWKSKQINISYTNRIDVKSGIEINFRFSDFRLPQYISGGSPSLYLAFHLQDSNYRQLYQPVYNSLRELRLHFSYYYLGNKKKKMVNSLYYIRNILNRNSILQISKSSLPANSLFLNEWSGIGNYAVDEIYTDYFVPFILLKSPAIVRAEIGVSKISAINNLTTTKSIQSKIVLVVNQQKSFSKVLEAEFETGYKQLPPQVFRLSTEVFSAGFASYQSYRNIVLPSRSLFFTNRFRFLFKNRSLINTSLTIEKNLTSYVAQPTVDLFSSLSIDSAVNRSAVNFFTITTYTFPVLFLGSKVTFENKTGVYEYLSKQETNIFKSAFLSFSNSISIVRNWEKKTFVTIGYELKQFRNFVNEQLKPNSINRINNKKAQLDIKQKFGKATFVIIHLDWLENSSSNSGKYTGTFGDISLKKEFVKEKISVALHFENFTNQSAYRVYDSYSPLFQSLLTIPLIKCNVMLSFSWNF